MDEIFETLLRSPESHVPGSPPYLKLRDEARRKITALFGGEAAIDQPFWKFGELAFPYHRMGAISSLDLFGLDELIIFAFYHANRGRYRNVADIGANIGLHSIMLGRCGCTVRCYEPDPAHLARLRENLDRNGIATVTPIQAAVSIRSGRTSFVRVLGNTTGSHLAGAKDSYGETEEFEVALVDVSSIYSESDLVKMDAEGHEAALLSVLDPRQAEKVDIVAEVGSEANASAIFGDLSAKGINMFSQKIGWGKVCRLEDMPTSHREGSLFVTMKDSVPW
ncbi:MAG: FkbM family methyltransferase [Chthoniobacterales bacterium]|jgi:FkbM family methyltransferase